MNVLTLIFAIWIGSGIIGMILEGVICDYNERREYESKHKRTHSVNKCRRKTARKRYQGSTSPRKHTTATRKGA